MKRWLIPLAIVILALAALVPRLFARQIFVTFVQQIHRLASHSSAIGD